jgi:hypothetical protein
MSEKGGDNTPRTRQQTREAGQSLDAGEITAAGYAAGRMADRPNSRTPTQIMGNRNAALSRNVSRVSSRAESTNKTKPKKQLTQEAPKPEAPEKQEPRKQGSASARVDAQPSTSKVKQEPNEEQEVIEGLLLKNVPPGPEFDLRSTTSEDSGAEAEAETNPEEAELGENNPVANEQARVEPKGKEKAYSEKEMDSPDEYEDSWNENKKNMYKGFWGPPTHQKFERYIGRESAPSENRKRNIKKEFNIRTDVMREFIAGRKQRNIMTADLGDVAKTIEALDWELEYIKYVEKDNTLRRELLRKAQLVEEARKRIEQDDIVVARMEDEDEILVKKEQFEQKISWETMRRQRQDDENTEKYNQRIEHLRQMDKKATERAETAINDKVDKWTNEVHKAKKGDAKPEEIKSKPEADDYMACRILLYPTEILSSHQNSGENFIAFWASSY